MGRVEVKLLPAWQFEAEGGAVELEANDADCAPDWGRIPSCEEKEKRIQDKPAALASHKRMQDQEDAHPETRRYRAEHSKTSGHMFVRCVQLRRNLKK